MARKFTPKVLTTNDLMDGDVIYLTRDDGWTREFTEARLFLDETEACSALARIDARRDQHVGAYLADAEADDLGRPRPVHFRERFRATGPSNYYHGKQAKTGHVPIQ